MLLNNNVEINDIYRTKKDYITPENFCYWLQGALELGKDEFSKEDISMLKKHLSLVFDNVTNKIPDFSNGSCIHNSYSPYGDFQSPLSC